MTARMQNEDKARVQKLCPGLRRIVDSELQAGNWVHETWDNWGFVVLLGAPFFARHDLASGELTYRDVNDPHYWKSEYNCEAHGQSVACRFNG
jgi:hypothetical protein